jgi:hypothetical protein
LDEMIDQRQKDQSLALQGEANHFTCPVGICRYYFRQTMKVNHCAGSQSGVTCL